jgi:hypothetical protein
MPADTERLTAAIGRRVRAIAVTFWRLAWPRVITRNRQLSHPDFYGPATGRVDAEGVVKARLNKPEASTDHANATQACLPIGPCCC